MTEQNTFTDASDVYAQMETDNVYKEVEPDANEIIFGQRILPDRPLTVREASKRKKMIMKLVDQKLKFKLIELMSHRVARETATTVPNFTQTTNNALPPQSFTSYQSQPNWYPYSGVQQAEGNWQQHRQPELQSNGRYGSVVDNFGFQSNVLSNFQYSHQHLNQNQSLPRKVTQNPNLICPVVNATEMQCNATYQDIKTSTKTSVVANEKPNEMVSVFSSSLISINCNQKLHKDQLSINQPPTKNQLLVTAPQLSNVTKPSPNGEQICERVPHLPTSFNSTAAVEKSLNIPLKPRRRRRYGRTRELKKQVQASAMDNGSNVFLRDKFEIGPITKVSNVKISNGNNLWNEMYRLAASIFRTEVNQIEPLSSYEQKLQYKILIDMSMTPDSLRSEIVVLQFVARIKIEDIISKAKMILEQVRQSESPVQCVFFELRENLIRDFKAMKDDDAVLIANETENVQLIHTKINDVIGPLLCVGVGETERNILITQLMANPRAFETSEVITKAIPNKINVVRAIKSILDEFMAVRPGKRFYLPINRIIDVPFVVVVRKNSGKISEENAVMLRDALIAKTEGVISQIKPKIIDPKFSDGSLVMVCANRKTFDLIKKIISDDFNGKWTGADLTVTVVPISNPLARSQLKTVLMKFAESQFYHFNNLMEQLKIDNPRLLVRRWELHNPPPGTLIDSTECIYVGVDIESLGIIEQMNRIAILFKSTVTFEICYDERNYLPDHALLTPTNN